MQFEKLEIHTVFLRFSNFCLSQNLSLSALVDLIGASLEEKTSTEEACLAQPGVESTAEIREDIPSSETAEVIWNRLKSYGWNDAVCAGILGNVMAEVGGQSDHILYSLDVGGY